MLIGIIIGVIVFGVAIYYGTKKRKKEKVVYINHTPKEIKYTDSRKEFGNIINEHRKILGFTTCVAEYEFTNQAKIHTAKMLKVKKASHNDFPKRKEYLKLRRFTMVREIVLYGYANNERMFKAYLRHKEVDKNGNVHFPHKEIIETNGFNVFGISTEADSNNRLYNTVIFGKSELKIILLFRSIKNKIVNLVK